MTSALAAFALAIFAAAAPAGEDYAPDPDEVRLFDLLKLRSMASRGIPESAAHSAAPIDASLPENDPEAIKKGFAADEALRAAAFDKRFGEGAYGRLVKFTNGCRHGEGCDKLAGAGLIEGAYKLRQLDEDVVKKVIASGSRPYRRRVKAIYSGMAPYLEKLRPSEAAKPEDAAARAEALAPIAVKVLSKRAYAGFMPRQP